MNYNKINNVAAVTKSPPSNIPINTISIGTPSLTKTASDMAEAPSAYKSLPSDFLRFRIETITDTNGLVKEDGIYIDYTIGPDVISMSSTGDIAINGKSSDKDTHKNSIIIKLSEQIFNKINITTLIKIRELITLTEKQNNILRDLNDTNFKLAEKLSKYERVDSWQDIKTSDAFEIIMRPIIDEITSDSIQFKIQEVKHIINTVLAEVKSVGKNSNDDTIELNLVEEASPSLPNKRRRIRRRNKIISKNTNIGKP